MSTKYFTQEEIDNMDLRVLTTEEMNNRTRGHLIKDTEDGWVYADNGGSIEELRPCKSCGAIFVKDNYGVDPCLGVLPGVRNACCGHGNPSDAYIQFTNGTIIRGFTMDKAPKKTCWNNRCKHWVDQNCRTDNPGSNCSKYNPIVDCVDFTTDRGYNIC